MLLVNNILPFPNSARRLIRIGEFENLCKLILHWIRAYRSTFSSISYASVILHLFCTLSLSRFFSYSLSLPYPSLFLSHLPHISLFTPFSLYLSASSLLSHSILSPPFLSPSTFLIPPSFLISLSFSKKIFSLSLSSSFPSFSLNLPDSFFLSLPFPKPLTSLSSLFSLFGRHSGYSMRDICHELTMTVSTRLTLESIVTN